MLHSLLYENKFGQEFMHQVHLNEHLCLSESNDDNSLVKPDARSHKFTCTSLSCDRGDHYSVMSVPC